MAESKTESKSNHNIQDSFKKCLMVLLNQQEDGSFAPGQSFSDSINMLPNIVANKTRFMFECTGKVKRIFLEIYCTCLALEYISKYIKDDKFNEFQKYLQDYNSSHSNVDASFNEDIPFPIDWKKKAEDYLIKQPFYNKKIRQDAADNFIEKMEKATCPECHKTYHLLSDSDTNSTIHRPCPYCHPPESLNPTLDSLLSGPCNPLPALNTENLLQGIEMMEYLAGGLGSSGVFLIRNKKGHFIVKQGSQMTPGELWCSIITPYFDLKAPKIIGLDITSGIGAELFQKIQNGKWVDGIIRWYSMIRAGNYIVEDFVEGYKMGTAFQVNERLPSLFYELGRVMSFDILINNFDRFPLIWHNQGNPDNVIFKYSVSKGWQVTMIDQTFVPIKEEHFSHYHDKLIILLKEVQSRKPGECLARVGDHFANFGQYNWTNADQINCLNGIDDGIKTILSVVKKNPSIFLDINNQVKKALPWFDFEHLLSSHDFFLENVLKTFEDFNNSFKK